MRKLRLRKKKEVTNYIVPDCLNCGKPLRHDDVFCSYCGQKNVEKLSFGSFINQIISGLFSYDSRFWTTFIPLLFKPGLISKDYIEGKRKRYVNPFQLYLQVSILFFLLLGLSNNFMEGDPEATVIDLPEVELDSISAQINDEILTEIDTLNSKIITNVSGINFSEPLVDSTFQYHARNDSILQPSFSQKIEDFWVFQEGHEEQIPTENALDSIGYPKTFWNKFYYEQVDKAKGNFEQMKTRKGLRDFAKVFLSKLSIALFIFLPVFTLSFKLLYYRKRMNYMEHLVFVFHVQTVFFLLFSISILIGFVRDSGSTGLFLLLFLIYLYLALRKFYGQGWFKTFVKFLILNFVYFQIGGIAVAILGVIAFMFN